MISFIWELQWIRERKRIKERNVPSTALCKNGHKPGAKNFIQVSHLGMWARELGLFGTFLIYLHFVSSSIFTCLIVIIVVILSVSFIFSNRLIFWNYHKYNAFFISFSVNLQLLNRNPIDFYESDLYLETSPSPFMRPLHFLFGFFKFFPF